MGLEHAETQVGKFRVSYFSHERLQTYLSVLIMIVVNQPEDLVYIVVADVFS